MSSKGFKIVIICNSFDGTPLDGAMFIDKVSKKLEKDDFATVSIVTFFKEVEMYFNNKGRECHYVPEGKEKYKINDLKKELREIEERYNTNLEKIMVGDYDYYHHNQKKAQEAMLRIFRFWEDYLNKENPDYILGGGQRFVNLIPYTVCKKRDTKFLIMSNTPFPHTFCFSEDMCGHITTLNKYWELNSEKKLTDEEKTKVEEYINSILSYEKRSEAFYLYDTTPRINLTKLKFFLDRAYKSFFIERLRTPYSQPWRGAYKYAVKIIRSKLSKILYSKPYYNEKYIFFPLHVEWDSPILVWNPLFVNQLFLIRIISRNLPYGVKLYVKEHPCDTGGTEIRQLYRIKRTPNVRLIKPEEDSLELIKKSEVMLVIAGTAGWETLLLGKSLINVGKAYFETPDVTWKVRDLSIIGDIIKSAIEENKYDEERFFRFVSAFMKVSYPGMMNFTQLYYGNESNRDVVLSEENIKNMASGIKKQLTEDAYLLSN